MMLFMAVAGKFSVPIVGGIDVAIASDSAVDVEMGYYERVSIYISLVAGKAWFLGCE